MEEREEEREEKEGEAVGEEEEVLLVVTRVVVVEVVSEAVPEIEIDIAPSLNSSICCCSRPAFQILCEWISLIKSRFTCWLIWFNFNYSYYLESC